MPAKDTQHNAVKNALIKEGWVITDDPFVIMFKGLRLYADLGAERVIAAEKEEHKIVVEVKVFSGLSPVTELEKTVGQYGIYRTALKRTNPERKLFLAVAQSIYQDFFLRPAIQDIISDHAISLLVFDPKTEEIVQWIS
jgi:hypothetical protein